MNKVLIALVVIASSLTLSCSVGRSLRLPSAVEIGDERYYVDTLRQRWGRFGDAPYVTGLFFRNERDTIVGTEKARVIRNDANRYFFLRRDTVSHAIVQEEYLEVNPYYYSENTLEEIPDSALNQVLKSLSNGLSPAACKRMADNHTLFSVELLVGKDGYILESCQYVFMDSLRIKKELLDFCAKVNHAFNHFPYRFYGSTYMKENDIPYGPTRTFFLMTEEGVVHPDSFQIHNLFRQSKIH